MGMRLITVFSMVIGVCAATDTIILRDGKVVSGSYLGGDSRQVRMVVGEKVQSFSIPDIARIEFGSAASSTSAPPTPAAVEERVLQPSRVADNAAPAGSSMEIPQGTQIVVRLIDGVDSERDSIGKTFRASLDEPIVLSGETIVSRGADITAKLVDDKQSGKLAGKTVLTLDLLAMRVNGRDVEISTEEVTQSSNSRTSGTLKKTLGLGALGAIIGGIAGGGRGAATGATVGAGTGAAIQVLTKGEKVKIPAETRLTFILQHPVRL